jgi:xylulokinase
MPLVIGVDSSTQSTKVEVRHLGTGQVVASASAPHPKARPPVSEQDPGAWWLALRAAIGQIDQEVRNDVVAISIAGQQHGLVLIDGDGETVRPAKLWNDTTSAGCAADMVASLGAHEWARRCGSVPVAAFTVTKLAWVAEHEPELLARTDRVMLPHDYLTYRLTGNHVTDRGDASGTGWFDPTSDSYCADLIGTAVPDAEQWIGRLPRVLGPHEPAGEVAPAIANELGLPVGTIVGPGTGDNMAAALGLGLSRGDIVISLGTSGTLYAVSSTATSDPSGAVAGFADAAGGFLHLMCTLNATGVTDTVAAWLGTDPPGLSALALEAPRGEVGPQLVPYFDGERTPNLPDAAGSWFGLRTSTTREQVARSAHDGVLCGLLAGLDRLAGCGVDVGGQLRLIGGGARSAAYRQRCADLHGSPVLIPEISEAVAAGAALQAASIIDGLSIDELSRSWNLGAGRVVEPADETGAEVRDTYDRYAAWSETPHV